MARSAAADARGSKSTRRPRKGSTLWLKWARSVSAVAQSLPGACSHLTIHKAVYMTLQTAFAHTLEDIASL